MLLRLFAALILIGLFPYQAKADATNPEAASCSTTVGTSSASILVANKNRRYLLIQNVSSVNLGVSTHNGTAAIGTAGTVTLLPGGSIEFKDKDVPRNAMTGICASGTCQVTCIEVQ